MKETPILFTGTNVGAIIEDRKTQTRRVLTTPRSWIKFYDGDKAAATKAFHSDASIWNAGDLHADGSHGRSHWQDGDERLPQNYQVGDVLWVRETFWHDIRDPDGCVIYAESPGRHKYRTKGIVENCDAGITERYLEEHKFWRKRPSIFMPRWASRITLELTDVRVERLQEITEEDAIAEGWPWPMGENPEYDARVWYQSLWDSINARRDGGQFAWDKNPWVFALTFKKL